MSNPGNALELYNDVASQPEFDIPVAALRPSSQNLLSRMLNPVKIIPTENGLPRDWRGLAELAGVSSETISFLQNKQDPTTELIQMWCKSSDSRCKFFSDLNAFLGVVDRYDVVEDIQPFLVSDAAVYKETLQNGNRNMTAAPLDPSVENNILTIEDSERIHKNLPLTRYDAFILYADEDSNFADQVIEKLEQEYKLKLCVKDRDLLPGIMFEHEVIGRLIEERCNRFLVIFSPNFLKSPANHFLVSYAQASALESRVRKIVPCMYEQCELPPSVRYAFSIKYNRSGKLFNFWDRLSNSVRSPVLPTSKTLPPSSTSEKLGGGDTLSDDAFKWWDVDKKSMPTPSNAEYPPPPSYSQTMRAEKLSSNQSITENKSEASDTFSINSSAQLISEDVSRKKWYKRLKNSMKKKDKDKGLRQAVPEQIT